MSTEIVSTRWKEIAANGDSMRVFIAGKVQATTTAAMLLLPAIHGANTYAQDVTQQLAEAGYPTLLIDIYAPAQPPDLSTPAAIRSAVAELDDNSVLNQIQAAVNYLHSKTHGKVKVGVLGFCIGGTHALLAASEVPGVHAAVGFYGMLRYAEKTTRKPVAPMDRVANVHAPLLYHVGDNDAWIDAATLEQYTAKLREHSVTHEIGVYPGAGHAFHEHHRPAYRPVAAQTSWRNTLIFLDWFLKGQRHA